MVILTRRSRSWLGLLLLLTGCVGTPVPVPIPIQERHVRLSTPEPTSGEMVVMGLSGAASNADQVVVTNLDTNRVWSTEVAPNGSFAALVSAEVSHELGLAARVGTVISADLKLEVPAPAGVPTPQAWVSTPDQSGRVTVSGTVRPGDQVLVSLPRTGDVIATASGKGGTFSVTLQVELSDELYLVAVDSQQQSSEHLALAVSSQSVPSFCVDVDVDGYGATGSNLSQCTGSTSKADCNDAQVQVNPGQTQFFTAPVPGTASDYDYNCDGSQERELSTLANCAASQTCDAHGWQSIVPDCGQTGTWIQCVDLKGTCTDQQQTKTQGCR